ncbi:unnamed protein product [Paramecium sonneborni]|uniref:Uncharacterized protein n=1 Tax=Paramecium sonneborni TaxID=65129 RepID=A0A8S1PFA9_9CILI|nr:unnamed protein product [Paramecium sonneborni]
MEKKNKTIKQKRQVKEKGIIKQLTYYNSNSGFNYFQCQIILIEMSQLAKILAIFQVDEVIILRYCSYIPKNIQFHLSFIVHNLQYLKSLQYLRKYLFPNHFDLNYVQLMNPYQSIHHLLIEQIFSYMLERLTKEDISWVKIGIKQQVLINQ